MLGINFFQVHLNALLKNYSVGVSTVISFAGNTIMFDCRSLSSFISYIISRETLFIIEILLKRASIVPIVYSPYHLSVRNIIPQFLLDKT